jgi:UDP:flavonoid glycosyltransferase YjiC (YdhE family)
VARVAVGSVMYLGDVAPYLAIAAELGRRGHDVVGVFPEGFRALSEGAPFRFHPYGLDASPAALHADPEHQRLVQHPFRNLVPYTRLLMARGLLDDVEGGITSLRSALDGVDAVVTHPTFASVAVPLAKAQGIPVVCGQLFPMTMPTAAWGPPAGRASLPVRGRLARTAWAGMEVGADRLFGGRRINEEVRRPLGVPARRGAATSAWDEADRTVLLASRHWFDASPSDWPGCAWGGFTAWSPPGAALPPEVDAYLDDGPPPVLVTLGTSAASDAADRFRRLRDDLLAVGERPLLLTGSTVELGSLGDEPGVFPFAPIDLVAPRCAAAVLSGALGSVGAAARAGIPTVVHPQLFDQLWNAGQAERLGTGVHARSTRKVASAVRRVLDDASYARRAKQLAAAMEGEDGASACADAVEQLLG